MSNITQKSKCLFVAFVISTACCILMLPAGIFILYFLAFLLAPIVGYVFMYIAYKKNDTVCASIAGALFVGNFLYFYFRDGFMLLPFLFFVSGLFCFAGIFELYYLNSKSSINDDAN